MPRLQGAPSSPSIAPSRSDPIRRSYLVGAVLLVVLALALAGTVGGLGGALIAAAPTPGALASPASSAGLGVGPSPAGSGGPDATIDPTARPGEPTASPDPSAGPTPTVTPETTSDPPEKLTGYVWPLRNGRLTSAFGRRGDGFVVVDGQRIHDGMDLATFCGDKIRAAHDGVVLYAGRKFDPYLGYSDSLDRLYARVRNLNSFPIVVVIDDGNGYRSVYVHLSVAKVGAGDVVRAGQVIGLEGATGRATGCHLHFALIRMDGPWQDVAPTHHAFYPSRVRERVDPFLVLPLGHAHAPERVRQRYFRANPTQPPVRPFSSN